MNSPQLSRRRTLSGLAAAGVGLPVLAACGGSGDDAATDPASAPPAADPSTPDGTASAAPESPEAPATTEPPAGDGAAGGLASTADIEVGGGTIFADEQVVVTQPTEGEFRAFSTVCTHQGCPVTEIRDGSIVCPCHQSLFALDTGEPTGGPATSPLAPVEISVRGQAIDLV